MFDNDRQRAHYDQMMQDRRPSKGMSCGYEERFDPFLLDRRPELFHEFDMLFKEAFPQKPKRLLDIGCGSGLYFPAMHDIADEIVGIDISDGMLKAAQELVDKKGYKNIKLQNASAEELPFDDDSFDAVIGFDVLHHVPNIKKAMAEANRVLMPGGKFASIEPNVLNPIVWLFHAIPEEERGALRSNYPWAIKKLVKEYIGSPKSLYVNHITASNNGIILAGVKLLNFFTKVRPFKYFSIRMLWTARKPEN